MLIETANTDPKMHPIPTELCPNPYPIILSSLSGIISAKYPVYNYITYKFLCKLSLKLYIFHTFGGNEEITTIYRLQQ